MVQAPTRPHGTAGTAQSKNADANFGAAENSVINAAATQKNAEMVGMVKR